MRSIYQQLWFSLNQTLHNRPVTGPSTKTASPPLAISPFDVTQAKQHQQAWADHLRTPVEITNSIGMKLKLIPAGKFHMGSPDSDSNADDDEKLQHLVKITKPFYLSVYEVTQHQYEKVMGVRPRDGQDDFPANFVRGNAWPKVVMLSCDLFNTHSTEHHGRAA